MWGEVPKAESVTAAGLLARRLAGPARAVWHHGRPRLSAFGGRAVAARAERHDRPGHAWGAKRAAGQRERPSRSLGGRVCPTPTRRRCAPPAWLTRERSDARERSREAPASHSWRARSAGAGAERSPRPRHASSSSFVALAHLPPRHRRTFDPPFISFLRRTMAAGGGGVARGACSLSGGGRPNSHQFPKNVEKRLN